MGCLQLARIRTPATPILDHIAIAIELDDARNSRGRRIGILAAVAIAHINIAVGIGNHITGCFQQGTCPITGDSRLTKSQ